MSLYNMLFGKNPISKVILALIGRKEEDFPRFRDCYINDNIIIVYTRTGGNNRKCWEEEEKENCDCAGCVMTNIVPTYEGYIRDYDDDFDNTYAYVEFKIPNENICVLKELRTIFETKNISSVSDKFKKLFEINDKKENKND